mgnify:CR=1 FL=1
MGTKVFKYNSTRVRWALYVGTAFLVSMYTAMQGYKSFGEIGFYGFIMMLISSAIQGLVAWRAFIDQSMQKAEQEAAVIKPTVESESESAPGGRR